jgi:hypothetical protein
MEPKRHNHVSRIRTVIAINRILALPVRIIRIVVKPMKGVRHMLRDGSYAAWFKTPVGQGTAIIHLADGQIWGRDSIMTYSGSCEVDGSRFTATVLAQRHTEGQPSIFGTEDAELQLHLSGTSADGIATYVGTAEQYPGVLIEGLLIFNQQQGTAPNGNRASPRFDPRRLPNLPKDFQRLRKTSR